MNINIVNLIEELKQKHINGLNDINDYINNFKILVNNQEVNKDNKFSSYNTFQIFKEEFKNLLKNYSILQYKDLESEEIGKVIVNVNDYLNELKVLLTSSLTEHINENYIKQLQELKKQSNEYKNQNKVYIEEITKILTKSKEDNINLINKYNEFNNSNEGKEQLLNEKDESNNQNNESDNIDKTIIINNKIDNNENSENSESNENNNDVSISNENNNIEENSNTQIKDNDIIEMKNFYNDIIKDFNNIINKLNINLENLNEKFIENIKVNITFIII